MMRQQRVGRVWSVVMVWLVLVVSLTAGEGAKTPQQSAESIVLEPGLTLELIAAEPVVDSPCALAFDEQGRLYVAENRGYPTGPGEGLPPVGRITRLTDRDHDGVFETHEVFADGLTFPNGLMPWRGGLIVTCAPDVLYLKDTDGDGRADVREVWLTGFSTKGSTQLRMSHPTLGLDGWVYLTSGLLGGEVSCPSRPDLPTLAFGRTDFRFRPDLSAYETCDGGGQFGQGFDPFGRRFTCYNRVQVQHVVLSARELRRNPQLAFSETIENCPAEMTPEPAKGHGVSARLYPISDNVTTADSHAGTFTAACGICVFTGKGLPEAFQGGVFSCDPTGNLVHFDALRSNGATFAAAPTLPGREFLASRDNWFRPVFLTQGPDGALYLCDMYRQTIEHPDYLPPEVRKRTNFEQGKGLGRIWRISDAKLSRQQRELAAQRFRSPPTMESLAARVLTDAGQPLQEALRLALQLPSNQRDGFAKTLRTAEVSAQTAPANIVAWLRLLDAFDVLSEPDVLSAITHPSADVREHGLLLAERYRQQVPRIAHAVSHLAQDPSPRVRFVWALQAGQWTDRGPELAAELAQIAVRDADDRWTRAAVLSSITNREAEFLRGLLKQSPSQPPAGLRLLDHETGRVLGSGPVTGVLRLLEEIVALEMRRTFDRQAALLSGIAESLRSRGIGTGTTGSPLISLAQESSREEFTRKLSVLFAHAAKVAGDAERGLPTRLGAIQLLAQTDYSVAGPALLALIQTREPVEVQAQAVRAVGLMHDPAIAQSLLGADVFSSYTPALREEVLSALLSGPQHHAGLLDAIEAGTIPAGAIDSLRRQQLVNHKDQTLRERAQRLFNALIGGDRGKVYAELKSCLELPPNAENGRAIFKKHCANCHRLDREGVTVGPDLFTVRHQPKEAILLHILIPEQEITPNYAAYVVETKGGRVVTGLMASETPTSITLRQALAKEETILRSDIEQLSASKLSLMPQGFEKNVTPQELSDLIAFLKGEATR